MEKTRIEGLHMLKTSVHKDERGQFSKLYSEDIFLGQHIDFKIKQVNLSRNSHIGTVRGMHFQVSPHEEIKIIQCLRGKIFDVIVDIRAGSPTFLEHETFEMSENCGFALHVPAGCAHGFQVLEAPAEISYLHSQEYRPKYEGGIHPLDPRLGINWPLHVSLVSERDSHASFVSEKFEGIYL